MDWKNAAVFLETAGKVHHIFLKQAQLNTAAFPTNSETKDGLNIEDSLTVSNNDSKSILNNTPALHSGIVLTVMITNLIYANPGLRLEEYPDVSK